MEKVLGNLLFALLHGRHYYDAEVYERHKTEGRV